jgi:hypothetical protein
MEADGSRVPHPAATLAPSIVQDSGFSLPAVTSCATHFAFDDCRLQSNKRFAVFIMSEQSLTDSASLPPLIDGLVHNETYLVPGDQQKLPMLKPWTPSPTVRSPLSAHLPSAPPVKPTPKTPIGSTTSFDTANPGALWKYPRFSTATTLADTGGPGFSMEELTSTDVSEDEDAILKKPESRARTCSRLTSHLPSSKVTLQEQGMGEGAGIRKCIVYITNLIADWMRLFLCHMRTGDKGGTKADGKYR